MSDHSTIRAYPRKRFFYEMFTRDIALEDCILDLIDNSVDSLIRRDEIDIDADFFLLSQQRNAGKDDQLQLPFIEVKFNDRSFSIADNCGGIPRTDAEKHVFNFGHTADFEAKNHRRRLGAYGIGMKRAIFKIGDSFKLESRTDKTGFCVELKSVRDWAEKDDSLEDWTLPFSLLNAASSRAKAGTRITIRKFSEDVRLAFQDEDLSSRLIRQIGKTYAAFLGQHVLVSVNGTDVDPYFVPFGESDDTEPAIAVFEDNEVTVRIMANYAARGDAGRWRDEAAGWYVICNGRIVLSADKTDWTGWGGSILPRYQPKYRGFVGIISFTSEDPLKLPWTTTKRALNRDAPVFQRARARMGSVARPVLKALDKFYSKEPAESAEEREASKSVRQAELSKLAGKKESAFAVKSTTAKKRVTKTQVNFSVKSKDLDAVRKHLGQPKMSKAMVGEYVFDYFMRSEGLK